jgi:predicted Na+-dependent transporter
VRRACATYVPRCQHDHGLDGDIVRSLLLLVLLPLVVGLFIRARYADHAKAWQPELVKVAANLALVVALATGIAGN